MKVELIDHMGSDDRVADSARVSFARKASDYTPEQNHKLIKYLAKHGHFTTFTHCIVTLAMTAPIAIKAQCDKHVVGFTSNTECFDDQTQVLTDSGWKYWAGLSEDDLVAVPSLDFQTYTFEKPKQLFVYDYKGTMLHCHSRDLDMLCTPNHEQPISYYSQKGGSHWTSYTKMQTKDIKGLCFPKLPPCLNYTLATRVVMIWVLYKVCFSVTVLCPKTVSVFTFI